MKIYLIRHGETPWNRESRIQGREDIPLSPEGVSQAESAARALSRRGITLVYSSPLQRARRTAELIAAASGTKVLTDERLTERDFGSASGLVIDIFHPERYADDLEPLDDVADRMEAAVRDACRASQGDIAVVSHGGSINALLRKLTGGELGTGKTRLINAAVNVLDFDGEHFTVEICNLPAPELPCP